MMTDVSDLVLLDSLIPIFDHMEAGTDVAAQVRAILDCMEELKQRCAWWLGYAHASNKLKALAVGFAEKHTFADVQDLEVLERMKAAFLELRSYVLAEAANASA